MDDLLKDGARTRRERVTGNDLAAGSEQALPPPAMHGKLTAVRVEHEHAGRRSDPARPHRCRRVRENTTCLASAPATAKNHIYWARRPAVVRQADDDRDGSRAGG